MQQRFAQGYAGLNVCSWRLASRSTSTRRRSLRTATVPVAPGNRTAESDPAAADRSSPPPATPRAPPPPSAATLSPSRRSGRRLRARGLIRRRGRAGRLGGVDGQISQFRRGGPRLECHRPGDGGGARWRHGFVSAEHQRRTAGRDALRRVHAHEPRGHGDERRQRGQSFLRPEAAPAAAVFHHGPRSGRQRLAGGIHGRTNRLYVLERSEDFAAWTEVTPCCPAPARPSCWWTRTPRPGRRSIASAAGCRNPLNRSAAFPTPGRLAAVAPYLGGTAAGGGAGSTTLSFTGSVSSVTRLPS